MFSPGPEIRNFHYVQFPSPFSSLPSSLPLPPPFHSSFPFSLLFFPASQPLNAARGCGERAVSSPNGSRRSPAARQVMVHFQLKRALLAINVIGPSYYHKNSQKEYTVHHRFYYGQNEIYYGQYWPYGQPISERGFRSSLYIRMCISVCKISQKAMNGF